MASGLVGYLVFMAFVGISQPLYKVIVRFLQSDEDPHSWSSRNREIIGVFAVAPIVTLGYFITNRTPWREWFGGASPWIAGYNAELITHFRRRQVNQQQRRLWHGRLNFRWVRHREQQVRWRAKLANPTRDFPTRWRYTGWFRN